MKRDYRILKLDPRLRPYKSDIKWRMEHFQSVRERLAPGGQTLSSFAHGHSYFGFHETQDGWVYREWAPNAWGIALVGDFNDWDTKSHPMKRLIGGIWELYSTGSIPHGSRVKIIINANGDDFERMPLYCKRLVQDFDTKNYDGVIWCPPDPFCWHDAAFAPKKPLYIYECHIGMSGEKEGVATFAEFTAEVLPRIGKLGYTAIQVMAVMEHPYYGSFGYQVSNFFAVSSRFGTPEDFKELVDKAHAMGIAVIMDIVHSHVVKNTREGLAEFDGTDYQFCHSGDRGAHPAWKTRLFNYEKTEVLHFLLSNVKYWMEEYHLDGFRFDGITSMLYHHHGLGEAFIHNGQYFSTETDVDAVAYLQLAATLAKEIDPGCILIAEDMSGMPGMCLPVEDGGLGFDYRLNMGLPDYLIKLMKTPDEHWYLGTLWYELSNRRPGEKVISYTESHDQALVGDKTLMFWLADKDMYTDMSKHILSPRIDRAVALHKMLRLITCAAGGEGYLNFMGNEFGHPEWVDFPREGNGGSYQFARRQWRLADDDTLRYEYLRDFDAAMLAFLATPDMRDEAAKFLMIHEGHKILAFIRGSCAFIFNFHPRDSYLFEWGALCANRMDPRKKDPPKARLPMLVFHSAWQRFGGFVDENQNEGLIRDEGVVVDHRTAVVIKY